MPEPVVGDTLDPVELDVSFRRMIVNVGASWDFFPGHHDPDYARAHGHPTVFANTSLFLAFADRVIGEWAGPRARIVRRSLTMRRPVHAGDTMYGQGVVTAVRDAGRYVDIDLEIGNGTGPCATASATVERSRAQ